MNEAQFWSRKVRPGLVETAHEQGLPCDFERVENRVANGTPDVDYCVNGVTGKIELKFSAQPARDTTPVLTDSIGLRPSQKVWLRRRAAAGGMVWVLLGTERYVWLLDARVPFVIERINMMCTRELIEYSAWYHNSTVSKKVLWQYCLAKLRGVM